MSERTLNLLRYPRRVPLFDAAWVRAVLAAGLGGVLVGVAGAAWLHWRQDGWLAQRAQLQAEQQRVESQQAEATARQAQARLAQAFGARAQAWAERRERLLGLHTELNAQAVDMGLRVERWQSDGRRLVLQAWLPRPAHLPQALARLSAASALDWRLQSLATRAGQANPAGVDVVFEAAWPDGAPGAGKAGP